MVGTCVRCYPLRVGCKQTLKGLKPQLQPGLSLRQV
jgi:hypothetical protein